MFKKNILLAPYTTFKIGGPAKYFYIVKSANDLIKVIKWATKNKTPFFILGNGSNILVSDKGFNGLVIKMQNAKCKMQNAKIIADAGIILGKLVNESVKIGLTGLEWAAGIPGTIGGAIRGNAGAFDVSMSDIVERVRALNIKTSQITNFKNKDCKFNYRESIFKKNKNSIILSAELKLKKGKTSKNLIKNYANQRKEKQPMEFFSAGCIFKNPAKQSAGYLIEQCGLKGKKIGGAMISEKHANFIVNTGKAKASDVKKLIDLCKEKVKNKFKIKLKEEIEYLGKF